MITAKEKDFGVTEGFHPSKQKPLLFGAMHRGKRYGMEISHI